jgi:hypothetical protein
MVGDLLANVVQAFGSVALVEINATTVINENDLATALARMP